MSRFLLIHGSCHGAWCWSPLIAQLSALGHDATAIDLPSHGMDTTPVGCVTLDLYAHAIIDAIDAPVILVGHSMAGYPITAAANIAPDKISALVYLCAYVPFAGKTLGEMRRMAPSQPLLEAVQINADKTSFTINPAMATDKFYHDVDPDLAAWAVGQLGVQPIKPQETPLSCRHRVPSHYIRCLDDRAIPPAMQITMSHDWPPDTLHDMQTSHSPFLSDPSSLAKILSTIAQRAERDRC